MADEDFDEHGIYRERATRMSQNGILVDEDGIWRDDLDHLSHFTYRTDSGLGTTVDKKSSFGTPYRGRNRGLNDDFLYHVQNLQYPEDSYPMDERSLNISGLDGSGSGIDDYSFDHKSVESSDVSLPELNEPDDSYLNATGEQSRFNSFRHASSDFEGPDGPTGRYMSTTGQTYLLDTGASGIRTRTSEFNQSGPFKAFNNSLKNKSPVRREKKVSLSLDSPEKTKPHRTKISPGKVEPNNPLAYMLTSAEQRKLTVEEPGHDPVHDQVPEEEQLIGDSLFTQEDPPPPILSGQQPSLIEFEQLEVALQQHNNASGDQMDLIGAYLRGLQDQDEWDEQQNYGSTDFENQYIRESYNDNWSPESYERRPGDDDIKIKSVSMENTSDESDDSGNNRGKKKKVPTATLR